MLTTATTYRTNSATTTGLNLGTRTFAVQANAVNVAITLRLALDASHLSMRLKRHGMKDSRDPSIRDIASFISGSPRCSAPFGTTPRVEVWAEWPPVVGDVIVPVVPSGPRRPAAAEPALAVALAAWPSTRPAAKRAAGG